MNLQINELTLFKKLQNGFKLLANGHSKLFWNELSSRFYSTSPAICLRRNLTDTFENPSARIPIHIRPLEPGDVTPLIKESEFAQKHPRWRDAQLTMVEADIPTCYVAVTDDNRPCYMQWLVGPTHNHLIQRHLGKAFPLLNDDQALLEGAYMHPDFRGNGIMPAAMARIAEKASELGCSDVITFVDIKNVPSLKGCHRAGFNPYMVRKDDWLMFIRSVSFEPCPDEMVDQFHQAVTA